jgi:hypothetical protein
VREVFAVVDVDIAGSDHTTMRSTGRVSVCAVDAAWSHMTDERVYCNLRRHIAGAKWPGGAGVWLPRRRTFSSAPDAVAEALRIVEDRVGLLTDFTAALLQGLEDPTMNRRRPKSAWDVIGGDD